MKKLTPIAALVAVAALALPVASWADGGTPANDPAARLAKIQERIQKVEARIATATQKIADLQQKLTDKCSTQPTAPAPAAGGGDTAAAPTQADRCARAQARLDKAKERLQQAQDRLAKVKAKLAQWLQNHPGGSTGNGSGSSVSPSDQAALGQLQQQLAGLNG
jgi:DNA repair exonuclease SbcCD ATPase subunit